MVTRDPSPSGSVYHYTRAAAALEHILARMTIKLSPIRDTNDPADGRISFLRVVHGERGDPERGNHGEAYFRTKKAVEGDHRIACFTQDAPGTVWVEKEAPSEFGWARDRMWGQYADGHRGMCLAFDRAKLERQARALESDRRKVVAGSVSYVDAPRTLELDLRRGRPDDEEVALRFRLENAEALYFTKRKDWSGEFEYRILLLDPDPVEPALIGFGDALSAIYVGSRFSDAYGPLVQEISRRLNVPAYQFVVCGSGSMRRDYVRRSQ